MKDYAIDIRFHTSRPLSNMELGLILDYCKAAVTRASQVLTDAEEQQPAEVKQSE